MNETLGYADGRVPTARATRPWIWLATAVVVIVVAVLLVAAYFVSTKVTNEMTVSGGVWNTPSYGGQEIGRGARVTVYLTTPGSKEELAWVADANAALARACQQIGVTNTPPTVTALPASVKAADEMMRLEYANYGNGVKWNDLATTEFTSFLDSKAQKVADTTTDIDGKYRLVLQPAPKGSQYIILAREGRKVWSTVVTTAGRTDLNDAALLREK